jgi:hypothetical protein
MSSMFPSPNRPLVNFAHSGSVNDRRWDNEGKLFSTSYLCRRSVPKREASVMAIRTDHALR